MTEEQYRSRDLLLKLVSALLVVCTFSAGVLQYRDTSQREFKRKFWEKQLDLYQEASRSAAQLSIIQDEEARVPIYQRFLELYHGEMVLVEDNQVKNAMKSFVELYIDYQDNRGLQDELQSSARALARTCRKSLADSWDIDLEDLDFSVY